MFCLQQVIHHLLSSVFRLINSSCTSVLVHSCVELCVLSHKCVPTFLKCRRRFLTFRFFTLSRFFFLNSPRSSYTFLSLTQLAAFWLQLGKFTIIPGKSNEDTALLISWPLRLWMQRVWGSILKRPFTLFTDAAGVYPTIYMCPLTWTHD